MKYQKKSYQTFSYYPMNFKIYLPIILIILLLTSCGGGKDVVYFNDVADFETIVSNEEYETKFKTDDLVGIHVSTLDAEASAPFNLIRGRQEGGFQAEQVDYLVDKDGEIDFPVIGKVKIAGLSPKETSELIRTRLSEYLVNPIINVRLKNFTVSVLGAVNRPGTFKVGEEKLSIMEAIGLAGDINIKGRRDNVQVQRDFGGTRVFYHLDLTSKSALNSPGFFLSQNDVVYVEPNKSGKSESILDQRAGITVSILSVLITSAVFIFTQN